MRRATRANVGGMAAGLSEALSIAFSMGCLTTKAGAAAAGREGGAESCVEPVLDIVIVPSGCSDGAAALICLYPQGDMWVGNQDLLMFAANFKLIDASTPAAY